VNFALVTVRSPIWTKVNCAPAQHRKCELLRENVNGDLRANCKQIAKFANFAKNCAPQGRKFVQKLRAKAKFAKNCDFARKGEICAKIAPRNIAIFFRDCIMCDFFAAAEQFHYYTLATLYVRIISFSSIIHGS